MGQKLNKKRKREEKMRQIKKLASVLAAVLLATQVIAVMPVHAEEVVQEGENQIENEQTNMCSHTGCKNYVKGFNGGCCDLCSGESQWTSNGDGNTHTYIITCKSCGEIARGTEQCVAANGVCISCGQEIKKEKCCHKECGNYSAGYNTYCSKCAFNVTSNESNNDGYSHKQTYECPGCSNKGTQVVDCYFEDGKCIYCGQEQKYTTCLHPGCERPVVSTGSRCEICSQYWEITTSFKSVNDQAHQIVVWYPCCQYEYISDELEPHSIDANERCYKCGYKRTGNNSLNEDKSDNKVDVKSETSQNLQSETITKGFMNGVVLQAGKKITSSLTSTVMTNAVNGAAVTTPSQSVKEAVGITDNSSNASFFVCNNKNAKKFEQMEEQAQKSGKELYNIFNSDLYTITKNGVIEKVHATEKPITLMFGLPSALQNKKVSIMAYNNKTGEYVEFEDTDNDPKTITIDATVFGVYALVVSE